MGSSSSKIARGAASGAARKFPARTPAAAAAEATRGPPAHASAQAPSSRPRDNADVDSEPITDTAEGGSDISQADFARRLYQMGVAQPNPTFSPSSTASSSISSAPDTSDPSSATNPSNPSIDTIPNLLSPESAIRPLGPLYPAARHNPTLSVLEAQRRLEREAALDFEAMGRGAPRRFVDVGLLAEAVELRAKGIPDGEVERRLRLMPGLLGRLGPVGALRHAE